MSAVADAPKYSLINSIALSGFSGTSYKPTRTVKVVVKVVVEWVMGVIYLGGMLLAKNGPRSRLG